ncbi:MAG: hypothetical protein EPN99_15085 [Frankiales bacterium]|nr:MAG: hypothetical protein EPN99_15085 [Frankiales bacterium]
MRRVTSCLALSVLLVAGLAGPGLAEEPVLEDIEVPTDFVPIDDPFVLDPGATDGGGAGATEQPAVTEADVAAGTSRFVPLPPTRVLDTREGKGAPKAIVPPKGSVVLQVTGAGGVPATGVRAVVLNVTLTSATGPGFVQVYPTGQGVEGASSNLNVLTRGQTVPVLVTAPVGDGGRITLYTHGGGHLLADVSGYFLASGETAAGRYRPLTPARILDTRTGVGAPKAMVGKGSAITVQVTGRGGVPGSGVSAVALNVTATGAPASGFVQVMPSAGSTAAGSSSNLNVVARQTVANLVVVPVGDGGAVDVYSSSGTHVLADVAGWFTDDSGTPSGTGLFVPVTPERLLDTRSGTKPGDGAQVPLSPRGKAGIPADGVSAVVLTVTATSPVAGGFVQVLPTGQGTVGGSSNLNLERVGQTVANAALATLGDGGGVTLYTLRSAHLLADVAGWFTGGSTSGELPPELQGLRVAERSTTPYDPAAWPFPTGSCLDTAEQALADADVFEPTLSDDGCSVVDGLWRDPWAGTQHSAVEEVRAVHVVPLPNAHASGGDTWDAAKREQFANVVDQLEVVSNGTAAARADRAPEAWLPTVDSCGYAREWAALKKAWDLSVTTAERDALAAALAGC